MDNTATQFDAGAYLERSFTRKGVGGWRGLYLRFIDELAPATIVELGAGAPDFLGQIDARRRIAVDVGTRFAEEFERDGIEFVRRDLDRDSLADIGAVDVAICSDVFEHLIEPAVALGHIADVLRPVGILFSHVPNEYRLGHVLSVMLGRRQTVLFHGGHGEWEDPHLRRFSDTGYREFLSRRFKHNLRLTDLRYGRPARMVKSLGIGVPYALQGGPTYASTNDDAAFERLCELKREIARV